MQAEQRFADAVGAEQHARIAGIFAAYTIHRAQYLEGPAGDILSIADRQPDKTDRISYHAQVNAATIDSAAQRVPYEMAASRPA